jgi:hypothetical protein
MICSEQIATPFLRCAPPPPTVLRPTGVPPRPTTCLRKASISISSARSLSDITQTISEFSESSYFVAHFELNSELDDWSAALMPRSTCRNVRLLVIAKGCEQALSARSICTLHMHALRKNMFLKSKSKRDQEILVFGARYAIDRVTTQDGGPGA